MHADSQPILEVVDAEKRFGNVEALRKASLTVYPGEVVALVGDNGAGKSTMIKVISGVHRPDAGTVLFEGRPVQLDTPMAARDLGIETVFQDLALAADLDCATNLFLGREMMRTGLLGHLGVLDRPTMRARTAATFRELEIPIQDQREPIASLSGGQRQGVAVARAVIWASKIVIMDEPTAALGVVQTRNVLGLIERVRDRGIAVVLISHNLQDVFAVSDRIEVLRLGRRVAQYATRETSRGDVVAAMTGALEEETL